MKKIATALTALAVTAGLAACSNAAPSQAPASTDPFETAYNNCFTEVVTFYSDVDMSEEPEERNTPEEIAKWTCDYSAEYDREQFIKDFTYDE